MVLQWQHIMCTFNTCNLSCGVCLGSHIRLFSYMLLTKLCAPLSCGVIICAHQGFQSLTVLTFGCSVKRKVVVVTTVFIELAGSSTFWSWYGSTPFFNTCGSVYWALTSHMLGQGSIMKLYTWLSHILVSCNACTLKFLLLHIPCTTYLVVQLELTSNVGASDCKQQNCQLQIWNSQHIFVVSGIGLVTLCLQDMHYSYWIILNNSAL